MPKPTEAPMLHRMLGVTCRVAEDEERAVDVIASTDSIDSYDEIVVQDWDLTRYAKNPVVLWNHNRGAVWSNDPAVAIPIGRASNVRVEKGQLHARLHFVDGDVNPIAERVWAGFKQQVLRAVSVGFRPRSYREELRDGKEVYVCSNNELWEISVVPIGANPDAVVQEQQRSAENFRAFVRAANATKKESTNMELHTALAAILGLSSKGTDVDMTKDIIGAVESLKASVATAEKAVLAAEKRAADETARADALADELTSKAVDALVGVKITAAEKGEFLELAKTNPKLFERMVAQRPVMKLLDAVIPPSGEAPAERAPDAEDLSDIHEELRKRAAE